MTDEKKTASVQDLVNVPTLVTSLLLAGLFGLFTSWTAQQQLQADLDRIEEKVDGMVEIIEQAHPRQTATPPEPTP